ncbi:MAG: PLD nuclease N-terminal domain-containing protein [Dehalococcoidia bacterium]|nr:PLD nuclease N-terminal domain-containing protein [Dehalococcoidia bacterium]
MEAQTILFLLPLVIIQVGIMAFALVDLVRARRVKGGNKWVWGLIIVFISYIGPILYFVLGREES